MIYVFLFLALIVLDYIIGRSPYSIDFYLERKFPFWHRIAEWAPADVLANEPRYLSWRIQIPIIVALIIMLAVFLLLIQSQIKSAPPSQSSILQVIQAFL